MSVIQHRYFLSILAVILLIVITNQTRAADSIGSDNLSNADLSNLISILDKDVGVGRTEPTYTIRRWFKLKKKLTTTTTASPSSIPTTPEPATTTLPVSTSTAESSTSEDPHKTLQIPTLATTPEAPPFKEQLFQRRDNSDHLAALRQIAPPSQQELVQQLSLLNTLLTSLDSGSNATQSHAKKVDVQVDAKKQSTTSPGETIKDDSLEVLNSILGGGSSPDGSSSYSNVLPRQIPPGLDTEASKALSDFLIQAAAVEAERNGGGNRNLQGLAGLAANANTLSSLNALLGNVGNVNNAQSVQALNPLLAVLGGQGRQQGGNMADLYGQSQPASLDFATLLASASQAQQQQPSAGLAGIGGGILSSIGSGLGSLGSSIASTVANVLSASGPGGSPRVRGIDTRLGLGYRLGDAADAQIMWDVGPQIFTEPIGNEVRPTLSKKRDSNSGTFGLSSITGKVHNTISAAKRLLGINKEKHHHASQQQFYPTRKPLSLLEIWNVGKEKESAVSPSLSNPSIPEQLLTPPLDMNAVDLHQMSRDKVFRKRSSARLKNYYAKPDDSPFSGHSTLTEYERMLLKNGQDVYAAKQPDPVLEERQEEKRRPRPTIKLRRKRPRPSLTTPPPTESTQDMNPFTEPEYGSDNGLGESVAVPKKRRPLPKDSYSPPPTRPKKGKKNGVVSDKHKWKPRRPSEEERDREEDMEPEVRRRPSSKERSRSREEYGGKPRKSSSKNRRPSYDDEGGAVFEPEERSRYEDDDVRSSRERGKSRSREREEYYERPHQNEFERESENVRDEEESYREQDDRPVPSREDFRPRPPQEDTESSFSQSRPEYNKFNEDHEDHEEDFQDSYRHSEDDQPMEEDEQWDNNAPPTEPSYDDSSDDYGPKTRYTTPPGDDFKEAYEQSHELKEKHRPSKPKAHRPRPTRPSKPAHKNPHSKEAKRSRPKFSLAKIFHYWMKPMMRRRNHSKKQTKKISRPKDFEPEEVDEPFERFDYKDPKGKLPKFIRESGEERLAARNKRRRMKNRKGQGGQRSFLHKISHALGPRNHYQAFSGELTPEANDSFLRRNQLKANQTSEALLSENGEEFPAPPLPPSSAPAGKSVMSFVRSYLSSKSKARPRPNMVRGGLPPPPTSAGSTLSKLMANPSLLNPLKILPFRKDRRPPSLPTTTMATTTTTTPSIHIGENMSLEELGEVLNQVKARNRKNQQKKKKTTMKTTTTQAPKRRNDEEDEEDYQDDYPEEHDQVGETSEPEQVQIPFEEEEAKDMNGIFIDIESGEVDVLKPVAQMTSFHPTTEPPPPPTPDPSEDLDGDGVLEEEMRRKEEIFQKIQKELKTNYEEMKKVHKKVEAKKRRKEELAAQGLDETIDSVAKYFDLVQEEGEEEEGEEVPNYSVSS